MDLFNTSLEERRQRFVHDQMFPKLDTIDVFNVPPRFYRLSQDWIDEERQAESPDETTWLRYLLHRKHHFYRNSFGRKNLVDLLLNYAQPNIPPRKEPNTSLLEAFPEMMQGSSFPVFQQCYPRRRSQNLLTLAPINDRYMVVEIVANKKTGISLSLVTEYIEWRVMEILLEQWKEQVGEWTRIRDRLIELLEESLQEAKKKAGQDFDGAVAVSKDGLEIMTANRVVVIEEDGSVTSYAPEVFVGNKILLNPPTYPVTENYPETRTTGTVTLDEIRCAAQNTRSSYQSGQQIRLLYRSSHNKVSLGQILPEFRVLITPRALVPELPPDTPTIG